MNRESMEFVVYIIHRCAARWQMSPSKVYQLLSEYGCINSYVVPHYEVLHTLSSEYLVDDVERYLRVRGYAI